MYRVTGATLATVAVGLVAVFLVAGMVGGASLFAAHPASGQSAKGAAPGSAGTSTVPLTTARTYQTTINLVFNTSLPAATPVPQAFSIYANVTYGSIDNTNTHAWVVVFDTTSSTHFATFTLNGTIVPANVVKSVNNGVPYQNYTWFTSLDKTTLGCAKVSCADLIPATNDAFTITAWVSENGASMGGGTAIASAAASTMLVSTYVNFGFNTPVPGAYSYAIVPIPSTVSFWTNTSWGWTTNATTKVWLQVQNAVSASPFANLFFSFNNSVNATNSHKYASQTGFNGTVAGVQYSYATWTLTLNKTTLACADVSCNTTLPNQAGGFQGLQVMLIPAADESGNSAGGLVAATGPMSSPTPETASIGSTLINTGVNTAPIPYQPLPYVSSGWVNVSWVNPVADLGNASVGGYVQVYDPAVLVATISLNNSVNTTNAGGVSFSYLAKHTNGTTVLGVPYLNYTWSITFSATAASLGATVAYNPLTIEVNVTANGLGHGGTKQYTGPMDMLPAPNVFVQYPTTAAVTFTSAFAAYIPTPFTANYSIAVTNAPINAVTTTIIVNVTDLGTGSVLSSTMVTAVDNQTAYQFTVNAAKLACSDPSCSSLPQHEFKLSAFVGVVGIGLPTNGSISTSATSKSFFLITTPLSASLVAPTAGAAVSTGNVTVSVAYLGSYVAAAVLNIYTTSGNLVFSHSVIELTPGVPVPQTWFIAQVGTYNYAIVMTTVYLPNTHYFNGTLSVITKGGTVFQNVTQWSNESILSGLSGAAAGTLLLVVGLIVGMIVAFILAGLVMRSRPSPAPPQAWDSKTGAGANTCSVCGKSFATPEELAAHGKSEHGMQ